MLSVSTMLLIFISAFCTLVALERDGLAIATLVLGVALSFT